MPDGPAERLAKYRSMRSAASTPEPFGGGQARPHAFVVQKHAARRLHYDFRLELGGVLLSWAIPRGPSYDPNEKRMAVHVEDHPVEYADFEGVIPAGNYGAGSVIVWDRGRWTPVEDPELGLKNGKLLFDLEGYKLRGRWQLVRTKRQGSPDGKEWLLIKKPDGWANSPAPTEESVLSGLMLEEIARGGGRVEELRAALEAAGAPRREVAASSDLLMLAETAEGPFTDDGWIFELKYDGYRMLAERRGGRAQLLYRRGSEMSARYPELRAALITLPGDGILLDGELVVLDDQGRPDFHRLQRRSQTQRTLDIDRAAVELPATLFAFDLLAFEGYDLRPLPVTVRKELLRKVVPRTGPIRYADHVPAAGEAMFQQVVAMGLEGIVGKRADAPYRAGRRSEWLKIPADKNDDFAVVGFTRPQGARSGFGALHLGAYTPGGELVYTGRVGSGFSGKQLDEIGERLDAKRRSTPPFSGPLPPGPAREHVWVEPELVAMVRFKAWTDDGLLRQPTLVRMRDDKVPADCVLRRPVAAAPAPTPEPSADDPPESPTPRATAPNAKPERVVERVVRFTNLDKTFWPEDKYKKGDLIDFYRTISPLMIEYLRDRPLVMTRFPDGIHGKSFFQKDAPEWSPEWIRTEMLWSEDTQRDISYFIGDDVESLLFVANMGTIPIHIWSSRVQNLARPDWCILDLDPKGAPWSDVVAIALVIRRLCEEIELPTFIKTSGSTGLHVLVPLGGQCTFEQCKGLGHLLARVAESEIPAAATTARALQSRGGRVYIDFLQNGHGKLLVAPYSVRPLPGAPVSTPLRWSEVGPGLDHTKFTIKTVPERMQKLGEDPVVGVLSAKPDLARALTRLQERVAATAAAAKKR